MSRGYVYALINPAMPGILKIGKTTRTPEDRAKQISDGTGVPLPFEVQLSQFVPDCDQAERDLHHKFRDRRLSAGREFFRVSDDEVYLAMAQILDEQIHSFLADFAPETTYVNFEHAIDASVFEAAERELGVCADNIHMAMNMLKPEDIRPALERWHTMLNSAPSADQSLRVVE